jgi:hypothetical protein
MSTQSATWISVSLTVQQPIFDPNLDIATVVFSHVQCVKTRLNLALVSKLWRDASKPAAAYPLEFDFDAFPDMDRNMRPNHRIGLLDNDEAMSLPYERVVGLLGTAANSVSHFAAKRGSVRLLKWTRENNRAWRAGTCSIAAANGQLPVLQYLHENGWGPWDVHTCTSAAVNGHLTVLKYLHENGCPWNYDTCFYAADNKHWDCLQYAVDNKCGMWEYCAKKYAAHLR